MTSAIAFQRAKRTNPSQMVGGAPDVAFQLILLDVATPTVLPSRSPAEFAGQAYYSQAML